MDVRMLNVIKGNWVIEQAMNGVLASYGTEEQQGFVAKAHKRQELLMDAEAGPIWRIMRSALGFFRNTIDARDGFMA